MEAKEIHVGELIKSTAKQRGYSLAELAKQLGISKQRLNGWLNKEDIQAKDLFTISEVMGYDFVKFFCQPEDTQQETKIILQIEVEKGKTNEVLKIIQDKQLYNILKK